jgi:hypothetical protein
MSEPVINEEEYEKLPIQSQKKYKWCQEVNKYVHVDFYTSIKILKRG